MSLWWCCCPDEKPGACCILSPEKEGFCIVTTRDDCAFQGGRFIGGSCDDVDCNEDRTGACCLEDETCIVTTLSDCLGQNGTYQGHDTVCSEQDCRQVGGDCTDCENRCGRGVSNLSVGNFVTDCVRPLECSGPNDGTTCSPSHGHAFDPCCLCSNDECPEPTGSCCGCDVNDTVGWIEGIAVFCDQGDWAAQVNFVSPQRNSCSTYHLGPEDGCPHGTYPFVLVNHQCTFFDNCRVISAGPVVVG